MAPGHRERLSGDLGLFALLTVLVWGLTAPWRGLWQDDTLLLFLTVARRQYGLAAVFAPTASPLRRLYDLPFYIAQATPQPILALQMLYGALWVGHALAAGWIAGMLVPRRPLTRLLVVALTLTATSDYLTDNLTALGYNFAVLTLLLAAGCGLRFLQGGGAGWCLGSAAALAASLWTIDVGIPALPFLALLVAWQAGWRPRARSVVLLAAWGAVVAPVALLEWRFLHDPASYGALATLPLPFGERAGRALAAWGENFLPWHWVFARRVWYPRPPAVIPAAAMALAAAIAMAAFALRVRRTPAEPPPTSTVRVLGLTALFAAAALAANAAYANITFAALYYRTHVVSRIWASLAIGILAGWAAARWPRLRPGWLAVPALFVGLGTWGGLERQDLFLSTWRLHQRELASIAANAPGLREDARVILRSGPRPPWYMATEADYLTLAWLGLIYDQPHIHPLRLAPERHTGCRPGPRGLDCWHEGMEACFAAGSCAPDHFDYAHLIVMDYDPAAGVYRLRGSLAGDRLAAGAAAAAAAYRPEAQILRQPLSAAQRRLLLLH
jgi:hypothetical protein